jgi:hypothetical protein
MNIRYFVCWLLGAWIAGSLFMIMVATQNFRSVDRLLAAPGSAAAPIDQMGHDQARTFLRYQVSEQNRWYFETWEKIQLGMAAALILAASRVGKTFGVVAGLLFLLLLLERLYLTPEIVRLGRLIDFVPQAASSPERDTFWKFHGAYSAVELLKLALALFLSVRLMFTRQSASTPIATSRAPGPGPT